MGQSEIVNREIGYYVPWIVGERRDLNLQAVCLAGRHCGWVICGNQVDRKVTVGIGLAFDRLSRDILPVAAVHDLIGQTEREPCGQRILAGVLKCAGYGNSGKHLAFF